MANYFMRATNRWVALLLLCFITTLVLAAAVKSWRPLKAWSGENPKADTTKKDSIVFTNFANLPLKPTRKISFATNEGS